MGFPGPKLDPRPVGASARCEGGMGAETAELGTDRTGVTQRRTNTSTV